MTSIEPNPDRIVGVDVETTGLDSRHDIVLEVALVVLDAELQELGSLTWLVPWSPEIVDRRITDPTVRRMHTGSGLLAEHRAYSEAIGGQARDRQRHAYALELGALRFLRDLDSTNAPLLGSNVGFDRGFLEAQVPEIARAVHYRNIDVSTVKELARRWAPSVLESAPQKTGQHRALADIRESVDELRHYRDAGLFDVEPEPEQCTAETWSWHHYRPVQIDGYWIRCSLPGDHEDRHEDADTGLTWKDER